MRRPATTPAEPTALTQPKPDPAALGGPGHTRWRRFFGLLASALTVCAVMIAGVLEGVLPVSAALRGNQSIKLSIQHVSVYADGSFPRFFQTRDGHNHTVVVVGLHQVRVEGLCASGKASTPLGSYVLRITTPPGGQHLQVDDLQMALEGIDGVQITGGSVSLNRGATSAKGVPAESGLPGTLPITATDLTLRIHGSVRWLTASGLKLSGVGLTTGRDVKECF
jgi:hypothetical protein